MAGSGWATPLRQIRDLFHQGTPAGSSDGQLLARFAERGDARAFEAIVGRHGPMVAATCRAVLRNEHDAEDAFQATFLVLARKARSVRAGEALGAWLHRVAYRAAVQASIRARRRQREEAGAGLMAIRSQGGSDEVRRLVHEEVDRLPDRHRLPVVLCDLEGLSYLEAAARLGLTEPTLRHRLARGRERLRERLQGRGISAGVVAATLSRPFVRAVVPLAWSHAAVAAATGSAAPAGAVAIAEILMRGMLMARIKLAGGVLLGASALVAAGVALAGPMGEPPPPAPVAAREEEGGQEARPDGELEMGEVRGIVLDPDGKPVAGATVRSDLAQMPDQWKEVFSGADGRFVIEVPRRYLGWPPPEILSTYKWLTASAPGFGLGINDPAERNNPAAEQVIRLVPDGEPIEGRLLDPEGEPIEGARVSVGVIYQAKGTPDDLSRWVAGARSGGPQKLGELDIVSAAIKSTTGPDGRFRITGVGRERVALVQAEAPGIATAQAYVMTREGPEIRSSEFNMYPPQTLVIHPRGLEIEAKPGRDVRGVVRDQESGQPIEGVRIVLVAAGNERPIYPWTHHVMTDAQGRYMLQGIPSGVTEIKGFPSRESYTLQLIPKQGSPYFSEPYATIVDDPETGAMSFDLELKRTAVVRGRVVDGTTGKPVSGSVQVVTFEDAEQKGYPKDAGYRYGIAIDEDGRFEAATLPGRGVLFVRGEGGLYRVLNSREHKEMPGYDADYDGFKVGKTNVSPEGVHAIVEFQATVDGPAEPLEIRLDRGRSVTIKVIDPEGQPLAGTIVRGLTDSFNEYPLPITGSEFEMAGLDPESPRRLVVRHSGRKLVGSLVLPGEGEGPIELKMQPWGVITGRVVAGYPAKPLKDVVIHNGQRPSLRPLDMDDLPGTEQGTLRLGDDGRFRIEGLMPGLKYGAHGSNFGGMGGELFRDQILTPGEVAEMGDLRLISRGF